jgi:hypothetical protein
MASQANPDEVCPNINYRMHPRMHPNKKRRRLLSMRSMHQENLRAACYDKTSQSTNRSASDYHPQPPPKPPPKPPQPPKPQKSQQMGITGIKHPHPQPPKPPPQPPPQPPKQEPVAFSSSMSVNSMASIAFSDTLEARRSNCVGSVFMKNYLSAISKCATLQLN